MTESMLCSSAFANITNMIMIDGKTAKTTTVTVKEKDAGIPASTHDLKVEGLISDLALILILGAITTLIFKKLKQPIVLGYIVAGFLASPHFGYLPTVTNEANIEFWAQLGIIILLFSLGLEFSFRKLMNVGSSAIVTALIIVTGMMGVGVLTGRFLDFSMVDSLFLGGMLSMSSTTIIIKAFTDLNMRQRKFVPLVFAVLICEDLFAVVMMVLLSSVAINNTVEGGEMLYSIAKLIFFLIIWFTVGVFLIPSFFSHYRKFISDEMLLIISMGMCLLMAIFSTFSGFSMALGAFVMGSILAGTCEAEHIEHVTKPVKDLFGAVFFISVGMMVNPTIIADYAGTITLLSLVVIIGMILFGTFGMLITGQSLKIAIESGFSFTQIGEFAFIIASLGMSLGVLQPSIYPIVVAVSVITTFFTPYFIKSAVPFYNWVARHLPPKLKFLLNRYSKNEAVESETKSIWIAVIKRYSWRILLYSTLIMAIIIASRMYLFPIMISLMGKGYGRLFSTIVTLGAMGPFILALSSRSTKKEERTKLIEKTGSKSAVPLVVMTIFRIVLSFGFVVGFLFRVYSHGVSIILGLSVLVLILMYMSRNLRRRMHRIEGRFIRNLNARELRRSGKENNLVSDFHLAYMTVGYSCPFVGEKLETSNIRKNYGANVVSIQRGADIYPIPQKSMRIFPGDSLGIIGTDEQIQRLLEIVEDASDAETVAHNGAENDMEFVHFPLVDNSPLIGKSIIESRLREDYLALLVALQRDDEYIEPTGMEVFQSGDVLWIVGNSKRLAKLKKNEPAE